MVGLVVPNAFDYWLGLGKLKCTHFVSTQPVEIVFKREFAVNWVVIGPWVITQEVVVDDLPKGIGTVIFENVDPVKSCQYVGAIMS